MAHDPQDPQHARDPQPRPAVAAPPSPGARPAPGRGEPAASRPDGSPEPQVAPLDTSTAGVPVIPPEEKPLDPRRIARESLAASRNWSLWLVAAGLLSACVVAVLWGGAAGALVIAAILAMSAVVRAVVPEPGPVALAVRARALDVAVLTSLAVGIGVLSQAIPTS